jgi:hypothetical protein
MADHYTREDIDEEFDEESRGVFRYPLMQMHNAVWQMHDVHTFIDDPDVAMCFYGDALFIQFPITEEEGILVTLDSEGELPEAFLSECKAIIRESEWERNPGSRQ